MVSPAWHLQDGRTSYIAARSSKGRCPEREAGVSCVDFYDLALQVTQHNFAILVVEAVTKAHSVLRVGNIIPSLSFLIEFTGMILVNKIIQVSGA